MLVIGAMINTSVKGVDEVIESRDENRLVKIAGTQIEYGAKMLALNCGSRIRTEPEDMEWMIKTIQKSLSVAICIDSPNPDAFKAGLKAHKDDFGKPLVNSITAEQDRIEAILPLVKLYDTTVVGLLMDERGMPREAEEKLKCAVKIFDALDEYGVSKEKVYLDPLLFPVSVDSQNGNNFLTTLKAIKTTYPQAKTICGLNNISFGLPEQELINHTFVAMCGALGMDAVFIEKTKVTGAAFKAIELLLGNDDYSLDYLKAYREEKLSIYKKEDNYVCN
ncbi:MAG: dihydropteroate synthase [Clostridia bacterium]|nr:dihydropteroate synthase [Clostridia bacterium]